MTVHVKPGATHPGTATLGIEYGKAGVSGFVLPLTEWFYTPEARDKRWAELLSAPWCAWARFVRATDQ